jgi:hypothetical protein
LLEPDAPQELVVLNDNGSPAFSESGVFNIPSGAAFVSVAFAVEKISIGYTFLELAVENTTDQDALDLFPVISGRTQVGFTVQFNGVTDSPNYKLRWSVQITEL